MRSQRLRSRRLRGGAAYTGSSDDNRSALGQQIYDENNNRRKAASDIKPPIVRDTFNPKFPEEKGYWEEGSKYDDKTKTWVPARRWVKTH